MNYGYNFKAGKKPAREQIIWLRKKQSANQPDKFAV